MSVVVALTTTKMLRYIMMRMVISVMAMMTLMILILLLTAHWGCWAWKLDNQLLIAMLQQAHRSPKMWPSRRKRIYRSSLANSMVTQQ